MRILLIKLMEFNYQSEYYAALVKKNFKNLFLIILKSGEVDRSSRTGN